jgi:hypothetical protein
MISQREIRNWFTYRVPNSAILPKLNAIGEKAKELAEAILENTPESADQTAALRILREAIYTANASLTQSDQGVGAAG